MNNLVTLNFIKDFDYIIAKNVNAFFHNSNGIWSDFLKFITTLGNFGIIFISIGMIMLLFIKTRKAGLVALLGMLVGLILTNLILKNAVMRPRPFIDESSDYYLWWKEVGMLQENGYSFPSGHTTSSMAFGFSLFICLKKKYSWLFLILPLLMGFTRIYFMVHYFSDVLGGLVVGALASISGYYIIKLLLKINCLKKAYDLPSIISLFKK